MDPLKSKNRLNLLKKMIFFQNCSGQCCRKFTFVNYSCCQISCYCMFPLRVSLLLLPVSYTSKIFIVQGPMFYNFVIKLECLSLASLSGLV